MSDIFIVDDFTNDTSDVSIDDEKVEEFERLHISKDEMDLINKTYFLIEY